MLILPIAIKYPNIFLILSKRKSLFMKRILLCYLVFCGLACSKVYHKVNTEVTNYTLENQTVTSDKAVSDLIAPYKEKLDAEMSSVVGNCLTLLTKVKGEYEFTLGNWMADALYAKAADYHAKPIDFAIQNRGGVRILEIPKGEVTRGKIFELMPFENRVVIMEMDATLVRQFLSHVVDLGGWPISKSLRLDIKDNALQNIFIKNKILDDTKIYTVALPDYIANGGDRCDFFKDKKKIEYPNLVRDAFLEYLEQNPAMSAQIEGRYNVVP